MTGGNGSDTFRFSNPGGSYTFGNDRITDFGRNDTIDLSSFDLQYNQISQSVVGTGASRFLLIDLTNIAGGGTITLTGVTSALGESSFIL
jgi:Ca2+-binding RTX toxin-like protein